MCFMKRPPYAYVLKYKTDVELYLYYSTYLPKSQFQIGNILRKSQKIFQKDTPKKSL